MVATIEYMVFRGVCSALLLAAAASAATIPFQVTGITGGFTTGCAGDGCGGKFQAEMGGAVNASGNLEGGTSFYVYCIDSQNTVDIPSGVYDANISLITNGADLLNTRYGRSESSWDSVQAQSLPINFRTASFAFGSGDSLTPSVIQRYQMEGWLMEQYSTLPTSDRIAIQDAMWQVMDVIPPAEAVAQGTYFPPPYPGQNTSTGATVATLLSDAAQFVKYDYSDAFFSKFMIITNASPLFLEGQDPAQELIAIVPTPEPLSYAAVTGALLAALVGLRLKTRSARI
jgi:hypothetical protein